MKDFPSWMESGPKTSFVIGGGVLLGGAVLFGLMWLFDPRVSNTPVYAAPTHLQKKRTVKVTISTVQPVPTQSTVSFWIEPGQSDIDAGATKDDKLGLTLQPGAELRVLPPENGQFRVDVWPNSTASTSSFEIVAIPDASVADTVEAPVVGEPEFYLNDQIRTVTVMMYGHVGSFVLFEN